MDTHKIHQGLGRASPTPTELSERSEWIRGKQRKRKPKFEDAYDFTQFHNPEVDSDFAEEKVFSAIDLSEYQNKQIEITEQSQKALKLPAIPQKAKIPPFKGTKFAAKIASPAAKSSKLGAQAS